MQGVRSDLEQLLLNLVLNAIDAMPAGGDLRLEGRDTSGQIQISIADTGPGLSSDVAKRIFEPFFTTKGKGTGLGLAIVYRIAEMHGGEIVAENREEGGAVFTLTLPRASRRASAPGP